RRHGAKLMIADLQPRVRGACERSGVLAKIGEENLFSNIDRALHAARSILTGKEMKVVAAEHSAPSGER
ncbi:MAG: hypothetical protein RL417_643, partial [Pseudomonadota bacterium]